MTAAAQAARAVASVVEAVAAAGGSVFAAAQAARAIAEIIASTVAEPTYYDISVDDDCEITDISLESPRHTFDPSWSKDAAYLWECLSSVNTPRNLKCTSNVSTPRNLKCMSNVSTPRWEWSHDGLEPTDPLNCFTQKFHFALDDPLENVASSLEEEVCEKSDISESSPRCGRSHEGVEPTAPLNCFMQKSHSTLDDPEENVASSPICEESDVSEITHYVQTNFHAQSEPVDNAQAKEAAERNRSVHMAQIAQRARWSVRAWRGAPIIF